MSSPTHTYCPGCGNAYPPTARFCPLCARPRENAPSTQTQPFQARPQASPPFGAPTVEPALAPSVNPVRLWVHRIFVGLSILWAVYLPLHILLFVAAQSRAPHNTAPGAAEGRALGTLVGIGLWFPVWLMVLIPLVLIAIFAKPRK